MRCENCMYFIKKLKCEITGDSMSRYDGCERGEYRETEKVVCKECKYFFRYDLQTCENSLILPLLCVIISLIGGGEA